ncbi:MAG: hypothetical protein N2Z80_06585 [Hydrogenothermaceae bacterium]|nr:hypothetical protein [Hydrogenothermaceae bacterium]
MSKAKGIGFGLTSGVITTLGMIVAIYLLSEDKAIIVGGILSIAIADSVSDAFGMYISKESDKKRNLGHIWSATLWTFLSKFSITTTFLIPVLLLPLSISIPLCVVWGYLLLTVLSVKVAKDRKDSVLYAVFERLSTMTVVLFVVFLTERFISRFQ